MSGFRTVIDMLAAGARHMAAAAAGFLTIPLVAHVLGADALGAWAILGTTSFLLGVADLGLTTAVQRATVKEDLRLVHRTVRLALLVIVLLAPLFAVASYFLLLDLPGATLELQIDVNRAGILVLSAGVAAALTFPFRGYLAASDGGIRALARIRAVVSLVQVAGTAGGLVLVKSLMAPAVGLLAAMLVELVLTARAARQRDASFPLLPGFPQSRAELGTALRDGAAAMAINLGGLLALRVDVVILSKVSPLLVVAAYGIAARAVDQWFTLAKQASTALMPRLGNVREREGAVLLGTAVVGGLVTSGLAAIALDGRTVLEVWAGSAAAQPEAALALALLAVAYSFAATNEVVASSLTLSGKTAWSAGFPIAVGYALNIAISVGLAAWVGVWAVAGGTLLGNVLTAVLVWVRARRLLDWQPRRVGRTLAPTLVAGVVAVAAGTALSGVASGHWMLSLVVCGVVTMTGTAAAGGAFYFLRRREPAPAPSIRPAGGVA